MKHLADRPTITMITTSVCIATFRRPAELERLLESLCAQQGAPDFEVIVVDNDPQRSAGAVAERFSGVIALTYCHEPIPGVAAVRNRAVAASRGQFLAFIDDDEWPVPEWLAHFHRTAVETGADGVFGGIANQFAAEVPQHIRACGVFDPTELADGADLRWWQTRTGNAYIRRAALPDQAAPFDVKYGLTGGEDTHMFCAMLRGGSRFVWSTRALVHSFHPLSRANLRWLFWRSLRYGGTGTEVEWLPLSLGKRFKLGTRSILRAARLFGAAALLWPKDKTAASRLIFVAGMDAGRTLRLLGFRIEIYRRDRLLQGAGEPTAAHAVFDRY